MKILLGSISEVFVISETVSRCELLPPAGVTF